MSDRIEHIVAQDVLKSITINLDFSGQLLVKDCLDDGTIGIGVARFISGREDYFGKNDCLEMLGEHTRRSTMEASDATEGSSKLTG